MFSKVLGSAVNPVLREGNSDRRAARPVKELAQRTVKRSPAMRPYSKENRSCVAHMKDGDFYGSEQSHVMQVLMITEPGSISAIVVGGRYGFHCLDWQ